MSRRTHRTLVVLLLLPLIGTLMAVEASSSLAGGKRALAGSRGKDLLRGTAGDDRINGGRLCRPALRTRPATTSSTEAPAATPSPVAPGSTSFTVTRPPT